MFDILDLYPLLAIGMVQLVLIGGLGAALLRIVARQRAAEAMVRERTAVWLHRADTQAPQDAGAAT